MGADAVIVYYGVRQTIPKNDMAQLTALELRTHEWIRRARDAKLRYWWGRLTDDADYYFLVGHEIGVFGVEGIHARALDLPELDTMAMDVRSRLANAGFTESPKLHFQLEAQY